MIGTQRRELFDRILLYNEARLRRGPGGVLDALQQSARPHHRTPRRLSPRQAKTGSPEPIDLAAYRLRRDPVLGGLTNEYQIAAWPTRAHRRGPRSTANFYKRAPRSRETL